MLGEIVERALILCQCYLQTSMLGEVEESDISVEALGTLAVCMIRAYSMIAMYGNV
jgi:hypothetical protein